MMVISAKTFRLSRKRSRGSTKKDLNLVSILVCVVVVFLFCNIPRVIINCYEFLCSEKIVRWAIFKTWHIKMLKQHILQWGFINCLDWLDLVLHQLQPPRAGVQRLRQLPHLLLLRQRLQANPPQACQSAPVLLTLRTAEWKFDKVVDKVVDKVDIEGVAFFSDLFSNKAFKSVRVLRCFDKFNQYHSY